MWKAGIHTEASCEDVGEGRAEILLSGRDEQALRADNLVATLHPGCANAAASERSRSSRTNVRRWPYRQMISGRTGTTGASDLASFSRPPVIEVALAVQFDPGTLTALDAATFRGGIRESYPKFEEQPARPPVEEIFDPVVAGIPFRFEVMNAPQMNRAWFLSEDGSRLVQLQSDLLAVNWRRLREDAEYPRYETLRTELEQHLRALNEILQTEGRDTIRPNWCEVTYINQVAPDQPDSPRPPLEQVLTVFSRPESEFLPEPEDVFVRVRFVIPGDDDPRGRFIVEAAPGYRNEDRVPIWNLTFTSRVRAVAEADDAAMEALDLGHKWAVQAFTEVISPEMQSQWGRENGGR